MKLIIVRHGQTWYNTERRYLGALDPVLNEVGIQQACALKEKLPEQIDLAISSPLARATQTAEIICDHRKLPLATIAEFRERNVGVFEGLTQYEAQSKFPELWQMNITRQWFKAPPGGETIAEVIERVGLALQKLSVEHPSATILLIAHGFVAKVIRTLAHVSFVDFFDWQLENGSLFELIFPDGWSFESIDVHSLLEVPKTS